MTNEPPILHTGRLTLRMGTEADIAAILRFYSENRDHLTPWWPRWQDNFFTEAFFRNQVTVNAKEFDNGQAVRFFLFGRDAAKSNHGEDNVAQGDVEPGRVLGLVNFNNIVRGVAHLCSVGYALDEREQGKGLLTEALREATRYMFAVQNLHRINANYIPHNVRSGAVLKRLGFVVEGYACDFLFINGQWQDHIMTSLINPNWRPPESG